MLTGQALGAAIESARVRKGVNRSELARHFGVKPESTYDWTKHGRVSKARLFKLFQYFSDVVGPEHWGLSAADMGSQPASQPTRLDAEIILAAIRLAKESVRLGANEVLDIERSPEEFATALRNAIALRERLEAEHGVQSGSGDRQASGAGGPAVEKEGGEAERPAAGRRRKTA